MHALTWTGYVTNWDDMELIWRSVFNELRESPSEFPLLLSEVPMNPKSNREKMAQVMFETFNVPAMFVAIQAVLAMYSSGRATGLVVDIGASQAHIVPIYKGYVLYHAMQRWELAGRDLTAHMMTLLMQKNSYFACPSSQEVARRIKEKLCYVALDCEYALKNATAASEVEAIYTLPDGQDVSVGSERYLCPEVLFHPDILGLKDTVGIHTAISEVIMGCEEYLRNDLYSAVVVVGGTTMLPGFAERLHKELAELTEYAATVKIISAPERRYAACLGGIILSSQPEFRDMCITKQEYLESGSSKLHQELQCMFV